MTVSAPDAALVGRVELQHALCIHRGPEELLANGQNGACLARSRGSVEQQMRQLRQWCKRASARLHARTKLTLPVSRTVRSAFTTSSWCATSSIVRGRLWLAVSATSSDTTQERARNSQRNYFSTHGAVAGLMATDRFFVALAEKRAADISLAAPLAPAFLWVYGMSTSEPVVLRASKSR